ncbi:lysozyme inhibitor LprI family protein [Burkholderia pseudomallei]|uniref:lysozyme inhibitor LprI family protein n=1 Tax=Burkholderia pseudomallei TaxID=28450 RepID=UPI0005729461|nr:lysozyme inhibitor LprI family protein [Burkholderia pseudomallei]
MTAVRKTLVRFAAAALAGWLAAAAACAAHAEVAAADPIDVAMRQCLARRDRSSTAGQIQCMDEARQQWQGEVDAAYQRLLKTAPADARRGWQESQRRWLAWRKDEAHLVRAVYETTQGTMYAMANADMRLQPVRERALALRGAADRYYAQPGGGKGAVHRVRPCMRDAACEHALFDMNRYYEKLRARMPADSLPTLVAAQREWAAFRDAMTPLVSESERVDLIGARVATLKRFSETVNNR